MRTENNVIGNRLLRQLVVALVAISVVVVSGCGVIGGGKTEVVAYLEDSAGLFEGNDVGILGVNVGKITAVEPIGDRVRVTMHIDSDHKLPEDVGAAVVARSVATDRYIELTPVYRGGPVMADGAEIPLERTQTPVDFDDVLAALNEFATGIGGSDEATDAIRRFIDEGTDALEGRGSLINQAIHSLADTTDSIHSQSDDIESTMKSLDVLLAAIAQDEDVAREFIQQVSAATQLLADERQNFRRALRALNRAVTAVAEFAIENREAIVEALDGSTEMMETIIAKEEELGEVLRVMPLALQNIQMATDGDELNVIIHPMKFFPAGDLLIQLCDGLPEILCGIIGTGN